MPIYEFLLIWILIGLICLLSYIRFTNKYDKENTLEHIMESNWEILILIFFFPIFFVYIFDYLKRNPIIKKNDLFKKLW